MTTEIDIEQFKKNYCKDDCARRKMLDDFQVSIESYEELLFGQYINSYATGERKIKNTFMILNVLDRAEDKIYYPVFSEKVVREMLKYRTIKIPRKITIFTGSSDRIDNYTKQKSYQEGLMHKRTEANKELINLIELVRALMLFKINNPSPMKGVFKEIYDGLILFPDRDPFPSKIKSINTALGKYIEAHGIKNGFNHLNDFIDYVRNNDRNKQLKQINFDILRTMFTIRYPHEELYF